jgi:hypothetical protein
VSAALLENLKTQRTRRAGAEGAERSALKSFKLR